MARRSLRNLVRQFRNLGVDVAGKGETVSDQVQLTYQLDNLTPARADPTVGYLGVGAVVPGVAGRFGMMELEVNNPGGIAIDAIHMGTGDGISLSGAMWTGQSPVTLINVAVLDPQFVQGTALIRGVPRPLGPGQTVIRSGNILLADTPGGNNVGSYWFLSPVGDQTDDFRGIFIQGPTNGVKQYLFIIFSNLSDVCVLGVRFREILPPDHTQ